MLANTSNVINEMNAILRNYFIQGYVNTYNPNIHDIHSTTQTYPIYNRRTKRLIVVYIKDTIIGVPIMYRDYNGNSGQSIHYVPCLSVRVCQANDYNEFEQSTQYVDDMEEISRVDFIQIGGEKSIYLKLDQKSIELVQKRLDRVHNKGLWGSVKGKYIKESDYRINPKKKSEIVLQDIRKHYGFKTCNDFYVYRSNQSYLMYTIYALRANGTYKFMRTKSYIKEMKQRS